MVRQDSSLEANRRNARSILLFRQSERRLDPMGAVMSPAQVTSSCLLVAALLNASAATAQSQLKHRPQPWQRRERPVLSAYTSRQSWSRVVLYSPHVIFQDGKYRMWYLGTSTGSRSNDIALGYAESADGIRWQEHPDNPLLTGKDIPWGTLIQTPYVLFDQEEQCYKLWFVSGQGAIRNDNNQVLRIDQRLSYATSPDGIHWKVHPRPLFPSARSPSVIKVAPGKYRMWMNSSPSEEHPWDDLYKNIYEFTSSDGLHWQRGDEPVVRPSGETRSCVYPYVLRHDSTYYMWYGCHVAGGQFEIYCSTSEDGSNWQLNHQQPAFPSANGRDRFDGRYTSTPCIVPRPDGWRLYYSARDWKNEYVRPDGTRGRDGSGVYAHIGLATLPLMEKP